MEKLIKNRHFLWIAAGVILVIYNAPSCRTVIPYPHYHQPTPASSVTAAPAPAAPAVPAANLSAPEPAPAASANPQTVANSLTGKWWAASLVMNRGNCVIGLELSNALNPTELSADVSLACINPATMKANPRNYFNNFVNTSATLTAPLADGTMQFHIDKNLGGPCPFSAFSLTPFGANKLAAQWEDACGGGQMVLIKTP